MEPAGPTTDHPDSLGSDRSYGGTRGYSGGSASADAAYADLVSGVTNAAQKLVLILAAQAGERGITAAEVREKTGGLHHGRVSSALTKQHIAGNLVALQERRNHSGIYVLREHVAGREVRPYQRQAVRVTEEMVEAGMRAHDYALDRDTTREVIEAALAVRSGAR